MRIGPALVLGAVAALLLSGCSDSQTLAEGDLGRQPQVDFPVDLPTTVETSTPIQGRGPAIGESDTVVLHALITNARGGTELFNSFESGTPLVLPIGQGQLAPAWESELLGVREGSRVVIVTPAVDVFGEQGNPSMGVIKEDTLATVFDVLGVYGPRTAADGTPTNVPAGGPTVEVTSGGVPQIVVPDGYSPPTKLVVQTLALGDGERLESGDTLIGQYVGVNARTGEVFDSSWNRGAVASFPIGVGQVIAGWDQGLVGARVGSRILLVIPPELGYGSDGNSGAGIRGTDTLIFVVDIVGRVPGAEGGTP